MVAHGVRIEISRMGQTRHNQRKECDAAFDQQLSQWRTLHAKLPRAVGEGRVLTVSLSWILRRGSQSRQQRPGSGEGCPHGGWYVVAGGSRRARGELGAGRGSFSSQRTLDAIRPLAKDERVAHRGPNVEPRRLAMSWTRIAKALRELPFTRRSLWHPAPFGYVPSSLHSTHCRHQ